MDCIYSMHIFLGFFHSHLQRADIVIFFGEEHVDFIIGLSVHGLFIAEMIHERVLCHEPGQFKFGVIALINYLAVFIVFNIVWKSDQSFIFFVYEKKEISFAFQFFAEMLAPICKIKAEEIFEFRIQFFYHIDYKNDYLCDKNTGFPFFFFLGYLEEFELEIL